MDLIPDYASRSEAAQKVRASLSLSMAEQERLILWTRHALSEQEKRRLTAFAVYMKKREGAKP